MNNTKTQLTRYNTNTRVIREAHTHTHTCTNKMYAYAHIPIQEQGLNYEIQSPGHRRTSHNHNVYMMREGRMNAYVRHRALHGLTSTSREDRLYHIKLCDVQTRTHTHTIHNTCIPPPCKTKSKRVWCQTRKLG